MRSCPLMIVFLSGVRVSERLSAAGTHVLSWLIGYNLRRVPFPFQCDLNFSSTQELALKHGILLPLVEVSRTLGLHCLHVSLYFVEKKYMSRGEAPFRLLRQILRRAAPSFPRNE